MNRPVSNDYDVPFNKPFLTGKEAHYMYQAVLSGKISGNGVFTHKCQELLRLRYGFGKCLLTSSCTDALEMAAILLDIQPGDEVIMPSYTFVSTANAFVLRGARIVFCDSNQYNPAIDADRIESLITDKTKVIVPVHYAGVACNMQKIMQLAERYGLFVVEDAAQAIDSFYKSSGDTSRALGSIGHLAAFSFHETKNIISGEGGMLVINDRRFFERAEIIWEKGTNRAAFFRGEADKYGWVDIGSSFLPSEVTAAFLWAQLEHLEEIQTRRKRLWDIYYRGLIEWAGERGVSLPIIPQYATNNAHMFYIVCTGIQQRSSIINRLKEEKIMAVFHYLSLHSSPYYTGKHDGRCLCQSDRYSDCLLRLPLYYQLEEDQIQRIIELIVS